MDSIRSLLRPIKYYLEDSKIGTPTVPTTISNPLKKFKKSSSNASPSSSSLQDEKASRRRTSSLRSRERVRPSPPSAPPPPPFARPPPLVVSGGRPPERRSQPVASPPPPPPNVFNSTKLIGYGDWRPATNTGVPGITKQDRKSRREQRRSASSSEYRGSTSSEETSVGRGWLGRMPWKGGRRVQRRRRDSVDSSESRLQTSWIASAILRVNTGTWKMKRRSRRFFCECFVTVFDIFPVAHSSLQYA